MPIPDTPRLTLRVLTPDDAAFYLELVNDPSFLEHIGDKGVRSLAQARAAIANGPAAMQLRAGFSLYAMQRKEDGALIGMCGLVQRDTLPGIDIGYALLPAYRGHGYCYEAASAVVAHARDDFRLPRLLGIVSPDNAASHAMLQKLGLRYRERIVHGELVSDLYVREFGPISGQKSQPPSEHGDAHSGVA